MKEFVGRNAELRFLEQYYGRPGSQLVIVYGSKGVGKTRLLQEFCAGKGFAYYLARACSGREQCFQWGAELREQGLSMEKYPDYGQIFRAALSGVPGERPVLVIDEFQYMIKGGLNFFDRLTGFAEGGCDGRQVMIVLVTSAAGWVENHLVGKIGSKAARINGFLKVRPFGFLEMRALFGEYSMEEALHSYAVLGGIPGYWVNFSPKLTAEKNIIRSIVAVESRLHEEMEVFLERELREPCVYNTILSALAGGFYKLNDIYAHTGFSRAKISVYLKNLMELDLVEKVYSFETAGRANAQKGVYRIANPYVRFYFRYLFPNQSMLQQLTPEEFYKRKIAPTYEQYTEESYCLACRELMGREYRTVGEWRGKTGNIDIVASDAGEEQIGVACCKWSGKMLHSDYERLLASMKKARIKTTDIRLYCERGFDEQLEKAAGEGRVKLLGIRESEGH